MRNLIRRNDIWRLSPLVALAQRVPAQLVTSDQRYIGWVALVPNWFFPASVGFAIAVWLIDPWTHDSRLAQLWRWITDSFDVEWVHAGSSMPIGEIELVAMLRFRRRIRRAKLWVRVHNCTHMKREPMERLHLVEEFKDVPRGFRKRVQIATVGIPMQGWDHTLQRGWVGGPETVIGQSSNVVSLELQGPIVTQRYKLFVELKQHVGNNHLPHLTVVSQDDDLFDHSVKGERMTRRVG